MKVKRNRIIVIASFVIVLLVAAGLLFRAPGLKVNGSSISTGMAGDTTAAAASVLLNDDITVDGILTTPASIGLSVDTQSLGAEVGFSSFINFSEWGKDFAPTYVVSDEDVFSSFVESLPSFVAPVEATVVYGDGVFSATASSAGTTLLADDVVSGLNNGERDFVLVEEPPKFDLSEAEALAAQLNSVVSGFSLTSGEATLDTLSGEKIANLYILEADEETGKVEAVLDEDAAASLLDEEYDKINVDAVDGSSVVDETGKELSVISAYSSGFRVTDTDETLANFVEALQSFGNSSEVVGEVLSPNVDKKYRRAEVNLSERRAYFYENDVLVYDFPVAIGREATPTDVGEFRVFWQEAIQDMGCSAAYSYCTEDVKWISYYNGDEAFHGTYWHNDFGNPPYSRQSHGCVNMTEDDAYVVYKFLQVGSPVSVHW